LRLIFNGVGRKISWGDGRITGKNNENSKKDRNIALLSLFQGWGRAMEKTRKIAKKNEK